MGYTEIEEAIRALFVSKFDELNDNRCRVGDADGVMESMFLEGEGYGCYIDYNGGNEMTGKPFSKPVWIWSIAGVVLIQYSEDIEDKLRMIVDKTKTVFDDDPRLGGVTAHAKITDLADAYVGQVNDIPFYFLPFLIQAIEPF